MPDANVGEVKGGIVAFEGSPRPPEGARVRIEMTEADALAELSEILLEFAGQVRDLTPQDLFDRGTPSQSEAVRPPVATAQDPKAPRGLTLADRLASVIGRAEGLPADLAEQHDHYIHGQARR